MKNFTLLFLLTSLLFSFIAKAEITDKKTISFGLENERQAPVVYIHGWTDDGALWGRYDSRKPSSCFPDTNNLTIEPSPSLFLERAGIENWAAQWWSTDGDPFSSSEEGYAFLSTRQELVEQSAWENDNEYSRQNRPCPSAIDLIKQGRIAEAVNLKIKNTYNDSGSVVDHANDLLEMLTFELESGKLAGYPQVNIVTHSKGSLVTRTMLSIAANSSREKYEMVANVVYNAPPFAGSSFADMFAPFFGSEDPSIIGIINNPFFKATFGTDTDTSVKTVIEQYLALMLFNAGIPDGINGLKELLPPGALLPLELLTPFKLSNIEDIIASLPPPNIFIPDFQVLNNFLLKQIRDTITAYTALPARPALDDLMMNASKNRLLSYPTSNFTPQFIIYGDYDPLNFSSIGTPTTLFPCDIANNGDVFGILIPCLTEIENDPDTLSQNALSMVPTSSDIGVSVGSARLLAETSRFGEPMIILAKKDASHGDLTSPDVVGMDWLKALTAAPTNMLLEGSIEDALHNQRKYQVSQNTVFTLQSLTENIRSSERYPNFSPVATSYEYRVVRNPGEDAETFDWLEYRNGETVSFNDLNDQYNLSSVTFTIEWRSINEKSGKEMIRSAEFSFLSGPPKIIDTFISSPVSEEVFQRKTRRLRGNNAIRSSFLANNFTTLIKPVIEKPEAKWVIRNQSNKSLNIILGTRGDLEYAWNETTLDGKNTTKLSAVSGGVVSLNTLNDGYNTLLYRTSAGNDNSPTLKLSLFVDNNPPQVNFECEGIDSFTCLVGPDTPIRYTIHDAESNGGQGELLNFPLADINDGEFFTLGQTNLANSAIAAGIVGSPIELTVQATDLVNNTKNETFTVYYDWTAPTIDIDLANSELLSINEGFRVFQSEIKLVVTVSSENGGFSLPVANVLPSVGGVLSSSPFVKNGNGDYETLISLKPGNNRILIASEDIVGNLGKKEIRIDFSQINFDNNRVETMSPRIQNICFNPAGEQKNCTLGNIENVVTSHHGDVVAFRSNGNQFVPNDMNASSVYDIFAWRNGTVNLVSITNDGVQANKASRSLAISGNGRYVYFSSTASNLVNGAEDGNLFIKDLDTGKLAVITRDSSGEPINHPQGIVSPNFSSAAVTFSGRYVFFVSHSFANGTVAYIDNLEYPGNHKQIYMVDLDPDENGSLFDDNYVTVPISNSSDVANGDSSTRMGNGNSVDVSVSLDGRFLSFQTAATDIDSTLANNGAARDILLMEFTGFAKDGTLDTSLANRKTAVVAQNASLPKISPNDDTVAYMQLKNNNFNLFSSKRNTPTDINNRTNLLISEKLSGGESSGGGVILDVAISADTVTTGLGHKIAWASLHNDIVAGDNNAVRDMFVYRESDVFPNNLKVPNWIDDSQPSRSAVVGRSATLSGDGRYAFWVNQQNYFSPYDGDGERHLYRRRIDPEKLSTLTIDIIGNGTVQRSTPGEEGNSDNEFLYDDESNVQLTAVPVTGGRFLEWRDAISANGNSTNVSMATDQTITAVFENTNAPYNASANLTSNEDTRSNGTSPTFFDDDLNDVHQISIDSQASQGFAEVINNQLFYTPNENYVGNDQFLFQITDLSGLQLDSPGTASVTVLPINDRPISTSVNITTDKNQTSNPTTPVVDDIDLADTFTFLLASQPENGNAMVTNNLLTYSPNADFVGSDHFDYLAIDSGNLSIIGTATITVNDTANPVENPQIEDNDVNQSQETSGSSLHPWLYIAILMLIIGRITIQTRKNTLQ